MNNKKTSNCSTIVGFLSNYLSQTLEDGEREEPTSQENDEDDFDLADESKSKVLQNCLTSIVDSLSHQNPKYVICRFFIHLQSDAFKTHG